MVSRILERRDMEETPPFELPEEQVDEAAPEEGQSLSRRDFVISAALLSGSMLLMLSRCKPTADGEIELAPIPPDFKRFTLITQSPTVETEKIAVAVGSQCPDLACALWWVADQDFQFFESVEQIEKLYVQNGRNELIWLD